MKLIQARHQRGTEQREKGVHIKVGPAQRHPQGAQPEQPDNSIAEKVPAFPGQMMNLVPAGVADVTEDGLKKPAQRATRMIGAHKLRRLQQDDANAQGDRQPSAQPEPDAVTARVFLQKV